MTRSASETAMARALEAFREARQHYEAHQFAAARSRMAEYRTTIDYRAFTQWDKRPVTDKPPRWTVVVVSYGTGAELLRCLDSIFAQQNAHFDVVLVNNGNNDDIKPRLQHYPLYYIEAPENLLPSEGRNIGAWAARGEYLAFIDDDGVIPADYLQEGEKVLSELSVMGARGRVVPKTVHGATNSHYDMGMETKSSTFNLEGNMVIRRAIMNRAGGFDPLMFGYEGRELADRCEQVSPGQKILYWPGLRLRHNFAQEGRLEAKRKRQAAGKAYIEYLKTENPLPSNGEANVNQPGISLILRAGGNLKAAEATLNALAANPYKPLEVFVLFKKVETGHLQLTRQFAGRLSVVVLGGENHHLAGMAQKARHEWVLVATCPAKLTGAHLRELAGLVPRIKKPADSLRNIDGVGQVVFARKEKLVGLDRVQAMAGVGVVGDGVVVEYKGIKPTPINKNLSLAKHAKEVTDLDVYPESHYNDGSKPNQNRDLTVDDQPVGLCAFIKVATSSRDDLKITLGSLARQDSKFRINIVIISNKENEKWIRDELDSPYYLRFYNVGFHRRCAPGSYPDCYEIYLSSGAELMASAISELAQVTTETNDAQPSVIVFFARYQLETAKGKEIERFHTDCMRSLVGEQELSLLTRKGSSGFGLVCLKTPFYRPGGEVKLIKECFVGCDNNGQFKINVDRVKQKLTANGKGGKSVNLKSSDLAMSRGEKPVWLFGERAGYGIEDNCWHLFNYCLRELPFADCYFVVNDGVDIYSSGYVGSPDRFIIKGTKRWADFVSRADLAFINNNATDILESIEDVNRYEGLTFVLLTHGAAMFNAGEMMKNHHYIDFVTAASNADIEPRVKKWGYSRAKFEPTGLARWDSLYNFSPEKTLGNVILICPTWRRELKLGGLGQSISNKKLESFKESDFFLGINSLINSPDFLATIDKYDLEVRIAGHFRLKRFLEKSLDIKSERIQFFDSGDNKVLQDALLECAALITDYSSVMWDVSFMEKPVILYQFDKFAFLRERNASRFDFPFGSKLFDICFTFDEVIASLKVIASHDMTLSDSRKLELNKFIPNRDGENCSRIIKSLQNRGYLKKVHPNQNNRTLGPIEDRRENLEVLLSDRGESPVAYIGPDELLQYFEDKPVLLAPGSWEKELKRLSAREVLFAPSVDNRSVWREVFGDPEEFCLFYESLNRVCQKNSIDIHLVKTELSALPRYYEKLAGQEFQSIQVLGSPKPEPSQVFDVSVIIPTYNSSSTLKETLSSIVDQDFNGSVEVIVIDDAGDDCALDTVNSFATSLDRLVYHRKSINSGAGISRNYGLYTCYGRYVMFVDNDDCLVSDALANLYGQVEADSADVGLGVVVSKTKSGRLNISQNFLHYLRAPTVFTPEEWPAVFVDGSCVGKLFRKEFLLDNEIKFPCSYHEDSFFMNQVFTSNPRISNIELPVYLYIGRGSGSGTTTFTYDKFLQIIQSGVILINYLRNGFGKSYELGAFATKYRLIRYDRFLAKYIKSQGSSGDRYELIRSALIMTEIHHPLRSLLQRCDDCEVVRNCKALGVFLFFLKHGALDLLVRAISGDPDNANRLLGPSYSVDWKTLYFDQTDSFDYYEQYSLQ